MYEIIARAELKTMKINTNNTAHNLADIGEDFFKLRNDKTRWDEIKVIRITDDKTIAYYNRLSGDEWVRI